MGAVLLHRGPRRHHQTIHTVLPCKVFYSLNGKQNIADVSPDVTRLVLEAPTATIPNASARTGSPMWTESAEETRDVMESAPVTKIVVEAQRVDGKWIEMSNVSAKLDFTVTEEHAMKPQHRHQ